MATWIDRPTFPYRGMTAEERRYRITNASMLRGPKTKIVWTRADQQEAYRQGFYVCREPKTERVILNTFRIAPSPRNPRYTVCARDTTPETNRRLLTVIAREAFRCSPFYARLFDFIRQQDTYGWFGAWTHLSDKVEAQRAASWLKWRHDKAEAYKRARANGYASSPPPRLWADLEHARLT